MKKLILCWGLCCLLGMIAGCNRNLPDGPLPHATNMQDAAEIYIFRGTDGVFWTLMPLNITFDNYIVARLGTGEYVRFTTNYGFHDIGISDQVLQFPFERGQTYFFMVAPDDSPFGFGIARIGESQGQKLAAAYKAVQ